MNISDSNIIQDHRSTTDVDIKDLNVLRGGVLTNQFILLICVRNSQFVIERCLRSIKHQLINNHDVGIIFIDDASTDNTYNISTLYINEHLIPQCNDITIIRNTIRKYLPRNLYNAITFLCTNPNSIIIQVDGDDLFEDKLKVFDVLKEAYSDDTVITFGSHSRIINGNIHRMRHETLHDLNDVWDLDRCMFWDHLKTYKRFAFDLITVEMLREIDSNLWIIRGEDAIIQPTIMDYYKNKVKFINQSLYIHDVTTSHDHFTSYDITEYGDKLYNAFKIKSNMRSSWKTALMSRFNSYEDALSTLKHTHTSYCVMSEYYALERKHLYKQMRLNIREEISRIRNRLN